MVGDDRVRLHQAKRLVGTDILRCPPFMASWRERSNLSADAVAYAETPIWRGYQSFLKLYTNSSDTNILTVF